MIENKNIRISGVEDRDSMVVVKDQDGVKYSFFKIKRDGSQTQPYNQWLYNNHNGPFKSGDSARIGFSAEDKVNSYGKSVTYRNIISILSSDTPVQATAPSVQPPQGASKTEETDWERIGKLKALHNLAGRRLSSGIVPTQVLEEIPQYMAITEAIEKLVDKPVVTIEQSQEDDSNSFNNMVDGIPFR